MRSPKKLDLYDCAVIGGGPGGLTSALYLKRFRRSCAIFQHGIPRADWIPKIHNLLGHDQAISGRELIKRLKEQVLELGAHLFDGEARVYKDKDHFRVEYRDEELKAKRVILATGVQDCQPPYPNLVDLRRHGVLRYCPICDGFDYCDEKLAVIVNGAGGIRETEFISKFSKDLHVILTEGFRPSGVQAKLLKDLRVKLYRNKIDFVAHEKKPKKGVTFHFKRGRPLFVRAAYVALGKSVNDSAYSHMRGLKKTMEKFIIVDGYQRTSVQGMYAVGDCTNDLYQISVASGHAAIAATDVHNSLF